MPQFDPTTYPPLIVWLVITFSVLYVLMSRLVLPRIGSVLEERFSRIEGSLARAESLRTEAKAASDAYEQQIAEARAKAILITREVEERLAETAAARTAEVATRLNAEIVAAETHIAEAKTAAMEEVSAIASDIAATIVQHLTGESPPSAAVNKAVRGIVKERHP